MKAINKRSEILYKTILGEVLFNYITKEATAELLEKALYDLRKEIKSGILTEDKYKVEESLICNTLMRRHDLTCRKCGTKNPFSYFAPVVVSGTGTCICFDCAQKHNWTDKDGNLKEGIEL